jgi:hypothetical protein
MGRFLVNVSLPQNLMTNCIYCIKPFNSKGHHVATCMEEMKKEIERLKEKVELLTGTIKSLEETIRKNDDMLRLAPTGVEQDVSPSPLQTPTLSNNGLRDIRLAPTPPGADAEHDDPPISPSPLHSTLVSMLASMLASKDKVVGRSFTKYFVLVLVLAILGSWYSLRGSLQVPNLSSSRLDVNRAPEVPADIAGRLRHLESALSISADSRTTNLCRLNAIERILEADAKTQHLTTYRSSSLCLVEQITDQTVRFRWARHYPPPCRLGCIHLTDQTVRWARHYPPHYPPPCRLGCIHL